MSSRTPVKTILILSANPKGTKKLRLDEEMREIKEGLRRAKKRDQFLIESAEAVRYRDIHRAIMDFAPQIVHFSGHGSAEEGLVFEDETGQEKLVDAEALAELFELFAEHVECVLLNACYSEIQALAIAQHIDYVIGMSQEIEDKAAIEYAVGFYDALGAGKSVEFAYKLGCRLIRMAGILQDLTPKLLTKKQFWTERSNTTPPSSSADDLSSERGVDYIRLRDLLAAGRWKEADQETEAVMLKLAGREEKGRLYRNDIENFPCRDLRTINTLWVKYSNGHFGFSVQKRIWQEEKENYLAFGDRVGWRVNGNWISYSEVNFSLDAPWGHLPRIRVGDIDSLVDFGFLGKDFYSILCSSSFYQGAWLSSLASRLVNCNIE